MARRSLIEGLELSETSQYQWAGYNYSIRTTNSFTRRIMGNVNAVDVMNRN